MAKKGLRFEEKRARMYDIFKKNPSFYHFKEIEKESLKRGIVYMSVKEVLDSLVNDNMVEVEKIGSSSYYVYLPSKFKAIKENNITRNDKEYENLLLESNKIQELIKESKSNREETKEREDNLAVLEQLKLDTETVDEELQEFIKCDPEKYEANINNSKIYLETCEMWKDNVYQVMKWAKTKFIDKSTIEDICPEINELGLFD